MVNLWASLFLCFLCSSSVTECCAGEVTGDASIKENPFTPKGSLIRYWNKQIQSEIPKSSFLLSMASPLNTVDSAAYAKLAADNALSSKLSTFCSAANLFCFPDLTPNLAKTHKDSSFATYSDQNFTNYGTGALGGTNGFKQYSENDNVIADSFRRYSRDSVGHNDQFSAYAKESNVVDQSFNTYGTSATGGAGDFSNYNKDVNVPDLRFTSYSDNANGRGQTFTTYTDGANHVDQTFTSYGKNGNGAPNEFTNYGSGNVVGSNFNNYGETGNGANDTFTSYGNDGNVPENNFKNYGDGGNAATDTFSSYRDQSNVGDDSFQSYAKNSHSAEVNFNNYENSFNEGSTTFTAYGEKAQGNAVGFKTYARNATFKEYTENGVTFKEYTTTNGAKTASVGTDGKSVNKWVEPGKFFRESMLKEGTVMPMPDIRDKMPKRSFLPRTIVSKLPFSSSMIEEMKKVFHAADSSSLESMMVDALKECERAPSAGETKRCVASAEDMIDFATSVLGRNVALRTTENTNGSKKNIMIGTVKGIDGGKVTESVSCHQSLYPYLMYYCHSVPKVRVYEADILDPNTKEKINHGIAICHLDTSAWSASHGAFVALGSGPGLLEVCHWIFEDDLTWTVA